uniref:Protein kinase domain-containing protein n=1 Tax=Ascaris lumbricoides TaxID=6252 RepID=A0A0M3IVL9_ASCLU
MSKIIYESKDFGDFGAVFCKFGQTWKFAPSMVDFLQNPLLELDPEQMVEDQYMKFAPSMVDFLQNPLLELDPEQMVEDQYMSVNNESFQWRASRMLMHESPAYFQMPCKRNEVTATMGPFLEEVIKQTALAIPELKDDVSRCMKSKAEPDASLVKNDSPASIAQNGNSECTESLPLVSDAHVKELAELLADSWKKLADALIADENFSPSSTQEVRYYI